MNSIDLTLARDAKLRQEAAEPLDPVHTGPVKKETQIIAIYGKGGIGKSFTLANLSYMMAQQGKRVLLIEASSYALAWVVGDGERFGTVVPVDDDDVADIIRRFGIHDSSE